MWLVALYNNSNIMIHNSLLYIKVKCNGNNKIIYLLLCKICGWYSTIKLNDAGMINLFSRMKMGIFLLVIQFYFCVFHEVFG